MQYYTHTQLANVFQKLTTLPSPSGGQIFPSDDENELPTLMIINSQRNLTPKVEELKKTVNWLYPLSKSSHPYKQIGFPLEVSGLIFFSPSPSGKKSIRIRLINSDAVKKGENPEYLFELWNQNGFEKSFSTKEKHGSLYLDSWFRHADLWSPDENEFIYIAEIQRSKSCSFFEQNPPENTIQGNEFDYIEEWGEQYEGKSSSKIFILNFEKNSISSFFEEKIENYFKEKDVTFGQVSWSPDHQFISFVVWPNNPERLGLKYCYNRKCSIYLYNIKEKEIKEITPNFHTSRGPKFSPNSKKLLLFSSNEKNTHGICEQLYSYEIKTKKLELIIDIVDTLTSEEEFPGLFPSIIFFLNPEEIILSSYWHSSSALLKISLNDKKIFKFSKHEKFLDYQILDVKDNFILVSASSPNRPPHTFLISKNLKDKNWILEENWISVTCPDFRNDETLKEISQISWKIHTLGKFPEIFQYIEINPKKATTKKTPLICFPHGGPHSVFIGNYSLPLAFLNLLGYSIILINYRGSTGFGKKLIDILPGKCGTLDVEDCFSCLDHALNSKKFDEKKIFFEGGSHSGFLGAWMTCNEKSKFKAAVLRNPVINMSNMIGVTDIPDWCLVESGASNLSQTEKMFLSSPLSKIEKVKTPTLLLLGLKDKRVPYSQGLQWFKNLKKNNVPVKMKIYPNDAHPIDSVKSEGDVWINTVLFWQEYAED